MKEIKQNLNQFFVLINWNADLKDENIKQNGNEDSSDSSFGESLGNDFMNLDPTEAAYKKIIKELLKSNFQCFYHQHD